MIATALSAIAFFAILIIALATVVAGVRSESTLWFRAYGIDPPRAASLPPRRITTARSVTLPPCDAVAPPLTQIVEPVCDTGSAAA